MTRFIIVLASLIMSLNAGAAGESNLYIVEEDGMLISAEELFDAGELYLSVDRNTQFCFTGNVDHVALKIREWHDGEQFFSGGGGGYVLEDMRVTKGGVVGSKISLTIRSEVTDEVEPVIHILRCPLY